MGSSLNKWKKNKIFLANFINICDKYNMNNKYIKKLLERILLWIEEFMGVCVGYQHIASEIKRGKSVFDLPSGQIFLSKPIN